MYGHHLHVFLIVCPAVSEAFTLFGMVVIFGVLDSDCKTHKERQLSIAAHIRLHWC